MPRTLPVLHVTLGLHMDGEAFPFWPEDTGGTLCRGPQGFLGLLETWYALPPLEQDYGQRIALCLNAGRQLCKPGGGHWEAPFYAASLAKAPWATARRLLTMIDSLTEAGWRGDKRGTDTPPRLKDMEKLRTALAKLRFQPITLRLDRMIEESTHLALPQPMKLELLEDRELWPDGWHTLFENLAKHGVVISQKGMPKATGKQDLALLQASLNAMLQVPAPKKPTKVVKPSFACDGSLSLLTTETADAVAEAVALLLQGSAQKKDKTVLLQTSPSPALDDALARHHLPLTGNHDASPNNGILQLLPLCLRMHWQPRSMQTLLDLLLTEESPVNDLLWTQYKKDDDIDGGGTDSLGHLHWYNRRMQLVGALTYRPGVGDMNWEGEPSVASDVWDNIMSAIREYLQSPPELQMPDDTDEDMPAEAENKAGQETDAKQRWEALRQWLLPETHDDTEGLPLQTICDTCTRLAAWANRRRHSKSVRKNRPEALPAFGALAAQCKQLAAMAENCGQERFPRTLLEDMLQQIASGTVAGQMQAAPWQVAGHPGVLCTPCDTLVWWIFDRPGRERLARDFWTDSELAWLQQQDCCLPDLALQHKAELRTFVRAISLVQKHCVLVLPQRENGGAIEANPWLDVIFACFGNKIDKAITRTDADLFTALGMKTPKQEQFTPLARPLLQKEWHTTPTRLHTVLPRLSPSQVAGYGDCPFATRLTNQPWYDATKQQAYLAFNPADRCSLPHPHLMLGNFAHHLVQTMVNPKYGPLPTPQKAPARMDALIKKYVKAFAAPLLEPDRVREFGEFRAIMQNAATSIVERIAQHGLGKPESEKYNDITLKINKSAIVLGGKPDLIWQKKGGPVIWDLKYSEKTTEYRDAMQHNGDKACQLAAYKQLYPKTQAFAFWLMKNDVFIGTDGSGATGAEVVPEFDVTECWKNVLAELEELDNSFKAGLLEAPYDANDCKYCKCAFVCGGGYGKN